MCVCVCVVIGNYRYKVFYELNIVLEKKFGTEVFNTSLVTIPTEEELKEVLHYMETWRVLCKTGKMPKYGPHRTLFRSQVGLNGCRCAHSGQDG